MPSTTQDLREGFLLQIDAVDNHILVPSCEFGKHKTNPPGVDMYGVCHVLEFTVGTDKAYYKLHIPSNWVPGTPIKVHMHWTRSGVGGDESGKTVKWQLKYLVVDGRSENVNSGESTLAVQDTYDSSSLADQIVYESDDIIIPASALSAGACIAMELMAVAPTGVALSEPACAALGFTYTGNQVGAA